MTTAFIEVRELEKIWHTRRGSLTALTDVNFEVAKGEFICILGPSGCGKSTVLQLIAGLEPITQGSIQVDGHDVTGPGPDRGMVFQSHALFPWRSVEGNIVFGLEMQQWRRQEQRERVQELIKMVGLDDFAKAFPREISGGMSQRVAVARALATRPSVLLMDEPFGALDAQTRGDLQDELLRIWGETETTVIFVTHSVTEALLLADRVIVMGRGPGTVTEIITNELARPRDLADGRCASLLRRLNESLERTRGARPDYAK